MAPCLATEQDRCDGSRVRRLTMKRGKRTPFRGVIGQGNRQVGIIVTTVGGCNPHHSDGPPTVVSFGLCPGPEWLFPRVPRYPGLQPLPHIGMARRMRLCHQYGGVVFPELVGHSRMSPAPLYQMIFSNVSNSPSPFTSPTGLMSADIF